MSTNYMESEKSKNSIKSRLIHLLATSKAPLSRTDLSTMTGLSKMTISNHVADLIRMGLVAESYTELGNQSENTLGRKPVSLQIAPSSPCICGIWLRRPSCQMILADISGRIVDMLNFDFRPSMTKENLIQLLLSHYDTLVSHTKRRIIGCGISSIGPIDNVSGCLTTPPDFYGITNVPLVSLFKSHTGLPTFLIHDAKAGGLAEKIYGLGESIDNYAYCHISHGIGLGLIINGHLFNGISGQAGEIGHTSIDYHGARCSCGNVGCLELYSSTTQMQNKIKELLPFYKDSVFHKIPDPSWADILTHAAAGDPAAVTALDDFCKYLARALSNVLKILDFSTLIVGYDVPPRFAADSGNQSFLIEKMLFSKMNHLNSSQEHTLNILHSYFNGNAPLLGSIAVVANEIFEHNIPLL